MAAFSVTFATQINMFGPELSTKWGSPMKWGTDQWGDSLTSVVNGSLRTISLSFNNDPTLFPTNTAGASKISMGPVVNTATFQQNAISESLRDGSGKYYEVLASGQTNDELVYIPSYAQLTNPSETWTTLTASSLTWVTQ